MDPPIQPNLQIQPYLPNHPPVQQVELIPPEMAAQFANMYPNAYFPLQMHQFQHLVANLLGRQIDHERHEREARNRMAQQNALYDLVNAVGHPPPAGPQQPLMPRHPEVPVPEGFRLRYNGLHHRGEAGPQIRVAPNNGFRDIQRVAEHYGQRPIRHHNRIRQNNQDNHILSPAEEFAIRSNIFEAEKQRLHQFNEQNPVRLAGLSQVEAFLYADYHRAAFDFYESFARKHGFIRPENLGPGPA